MKKIIILISALALVSAQGSGSHAGPRHDARDDARRQARAMDSCRPLFHSEDIAIVPPAIQEEALEAGRREDDLRSDSLLATAHAHAAAEREVSKLTWFGVGCVVNIAGFAIATLTTPPPPESDLIGKSPEYVDTYTTAYKERARNIQMVYAGWGCATSTGSCCVFSYIVLVDWTKSLAEAIGLSILESLFEAFFGS